MCAYEMMREGESGVCAKTCMMDGLTHTQHNYRYQTALSVQDFWFLLF